MAGELTTTNYGWVKPTVGASTDAWGGYINSDLDGIDTTVKSVSNAIPVASSTTPAMDGAAAVGTGTTWARSDHIHPTDTSRASVAQVNALPVAIGDNRIINGDMRIDQRNNGASGTAFGVYTVDRWGYGAGQAGKGTWQRSAGAGALALGLSYYLNFTSSSAYTPIAGDSFYFYQPVEADMVGDLAWGTSGAQPVTLSFWVLSSLTGTFSGAIRNYPLPSTRSYPFTYSIPAAGVWTRIVVTIPGDTAGTWVLSGNAAAFAVHFELGGSATFRAPAGAWTSGNFTGANGAVSVVGTLNANFQVTGVKLEIGSVATPYNRQSLAKSLADCQRYYFQGNQLWMMGYSAAGQNMGQTITLPVTMRAVPTISFITPSYTNASGLTTAYITQAYFSAYAVATALGQVNWTATGMTASAEL